MPIEFDPNRHRLAYVYGTLLSPKSRRSFDEAERVLREEYGFPIESDLPEDDFQQLLLDDRQGVAECWSTWREVWEGDNVEAYAEYAQEELVAQEDWEPGPPYRVIYADPPWMFRTKKVGGNLKSGSAQQYRVMTAGEIAALPIRKLAHPDGAALFMWGTTAMLPEAWAAFQAWGVEYKTTIYWVKGRFGDEHAEEDEGKILGRLGMGYWFRNAVEYCFVGRFGHDVKAFHCQERNVVVTPAEQHSKKPEKVRALIERATEELGGPRIELFSRDYVRGWDHWGDEIEPDVRLVEGVWRR